MNVQEIAALLTALAVTIGAVWSVVSGRKQRRHDDAQGLWGDAMDIIARLREENARLLEENARLKQPSAQRRRVRRPATAKKVT